MEDHRISMDEQLGSIPGLLLFIHGNVQSNGFVSCNLLTTMLSNVMGPLVDA